jgi:para-nitrobenzyl esterase
VSATVEVATGAGALRGEAGDGVQIFRGIPYAASTAGEGRFRPPSPVSPWDGVRDALAFGPACPQGAGAGAGGRASALGGLFGPGEHGTSEDCLSLNVWTPGCDGARRPVMVWIHGGAFRMGAGTAATYDGAGLARRGDVVVVTLNYRLHALGFLHVPGLGAVNLGLQDQVAALRWVRSEIAAFGGNPDDVTLFGESAGAKSVECLLAMPSARGLFHRAVLQSTYDPPLDDGPAAEHGREVLGRAGIGPDDLEAARSVPLETLLAAVDGGEGGGGLGGPGLSPVVDGEVLPEAPIDALRSGRAADVPLLIGSNTDESRLFGATMMGELDEATVRTMLAGVLPGDGDPAVTDRALEVYGRTLAERGASQRPADVYFAASTDRMFRQHAIALAEAASARRIATWMYLFGWRSPVADGALGACHALEIPFVFGNLDGPLAQLAGAGSGGGELSGTMQDAWLAFARGGSPGWPAYDGTTRTTMVFGRSSAPADDPLAAERELWAELRA